MMGMDGWDDDDDDDDNNHANRRYYVQYEYYFLCGVFLLNISEWEFIMCVCMCKNVLSDGKLLYFFRSTLVGAKLSGCDFLNLLIFSMHMSFFFYLNK